MFQKHLTALAALVLYVSIGVAQNLNLGASLFQGEQHPYVALLDGQATNKHKLRPQISTLRFPEASESSDSLLKALLDEVNALLDFSKKVSQSATSRTSTDQLDSTYIFYPTDEGEPTEKLFYQYDGTGLLTEAITWVDDQMTIRLSYVYDEASRLEQQIKSQYDGSNWDPVLMIEWAYENTSDPASSITIHNWDWTTMDWVAALQYQLTYDDQGKLQTKRLYLIDHLGMLVDLQFRQVYVYDFLDRQSDEIDQYKCLAQTDQWRQSQNLHFVYGPENQISQKIQHAWNVDHWQQEGNKVLYTYNALEQLTEERAYNSYPSGQTVWQATHQDSFIYNDAEQTVQLVASAWGGQQQDWVPQIITDSIKNLEGFVEEVIQSTSCGGQFAPKKKELYTYNESGQLVEMLTQYWDNLIQSWTFSYQTVNTYTKAGKLSLRTFQYWDTFGQQWADSYRQVLIYDDLDRLSQSIYEYWLIGDWVISGTDYFVYNSADQLIEHLIGDQWKINYTYDENGYLQEDIQSTQGLINGVVEWIPQQRYTYSYNSEGEETLSEHFQFDINTSTWLPDSRTQIQYLGDHSSPRQKIYEHLYPTQITDELETITLHFWNPGDLTNAGAVPKAKSLNCHCRNPYRSNSLIQCTDWLAAESGTLYLVDLLGRVRIHSNFSGQIRLSTNHLEAGAYCLILRKADGATFNQMIILD